MMQGFWVVTARGGKYGAACRLLRMPLRRPVGQEVTGKACFPRAPPIRMPHSSK